MMKKNNVFLLLLLSLALVHSALGAPLRPFKYGLKAYHHGDYDIALKIWQPLAEQGNAHAQFYMGKLYEIGSVSIPQNWDKAFYWYEKSATHGSTIAGYHLAQLFDEGRGTLPNKQKAFFWYQQAATSNHAPSQSQLSLMYLQGIGIVKDNDKALYWQLRAVQQGLPEGFFHLAHFFKKGIATDEDKKEATRLIEKAAQAGAANAQFSLAMTYMEGEHKPKDIFNAYLWFYLAALGGHQGGKQAEQLMLKRLTQDEITKLRTQAHDLQKTYP